MKYSFILLISTASIISVTGKIPDYIHICKRNDPDITTCVKNSILSLKDKLVEGIPELNVPSMDPLRVEKLDLKFGSGFKAEIHDLELKGAKNFELNDLVVDLETGNYTFAVSIPEIVATGTYDIDMKIASIPIKGKGPIQFVAKSIASRGSLHGQKILRSGKTFYWFPTMNMQFSIADYDIKLENLFEGDEIIGKVTNRVLNEEKTEVLAALIPALEKALIEHILRMSNNICKSFTWDELFPES